MNWPRLNCWIYTVLLSLFLSASAFAAQKQLAFGHVPGVVAQGKTARIGHLAGTNQLRLAIGLPLRNAEELTNLLRNIYDPVSPRFHHYLTPAEFTAQFGPTLSDYAAVINFTRSNGLTIAGMHSNRLLVDVTGKAADVERAFKIRLNTYRHPKENRTFFAPEVEPVVDAALPILNVSGLDNFSLPHPNVRLKPNGLKTKTAPHGGTGPGGGYIGQDFRKAYAPETQLTGVGQNIALLQFDGFYPQDITNYANTIGLAQMPQVIVLPIDGGVAAPGSGVVEVSLDIEMSMAMAPGVSNIYVYEAPNPSPWVDLLSRMADDNLARQLSCSWGGGGPNAAAEAIFQQMAAQGQTFFNASGDSDAFIGAVPFPSESPNITQVGGTTLTTDGSGNFVSETAWNWGGGQGSSGGISTTVAIPSWQTGIDMTTNLGSTSLRNIPDVALTADNVYLIYGNGATGQAGGTSCAAPLWAGFMALINEQATTAARPTAGFINPAVYAICTGTNYTDNFHDTTYGDNYWSGSPTNFPAVPGFDLCTGWGTPVGQVLMTALAGPPEPLGVIPDRAFMASGFSGGPFSAVSQNFTLTNFSQTFLNWATISPAAWLDVSASNGTLAVAGQVPLTVGLNAGASNLLPGTYVATVSFTNLTSGILQNHNFTLKIADSLGLSPGGGFSARGPVGGPFTATNFTLLLSNNSVTNLDWSLGATPDWLVATPAGGTLAAHQLVSIALVLPDAAALPSGHYLTALAVTNQTLNTVQFVPINLMIAQSLVQNGGFETGDFTDWTLVGDTAFGNLVYNAVATDDDFASPVDIVHSGTYGAFLGQGGYLAMLTQTLPTRLNQLYQVSFWLDNPISISPQQFIATWNGTNLINLVNPPVLTWTNYQFLVTAGDINTDLQFGAQNDANYFGLDDVTVVPVPPVMFQNALVSPAGLSLVWSSSAGLNYEIQMTTNLAPVVWQTIASISAGTNFCGFIDTNTLTATDQRYYRLVLMP